MFTLADFVRLNRRRHPERLAVSDGVDDLTHRVLSDRAWAIAEDFARVACKPGIV